MKAKAYAKINLTLDIIGKRADGYHLIDSVMQSVSLADEITVEKADEITVECGKSEICGDNNIAYKAAQSFFYHTSLSGGAKIAIEKQIPLAAGLGGGSADAAAVICALDKIYDTKLSVTELQQIALTVGADVPFCISGGTARVGGIGEEIKPINSCPDCTLILIKHGNKLSTADMYKKIDSAPAVCRNTPNAVDALACGSLDSLSKNIGNAFSTVCYDEKLINDIKSTSPLAVSLSGSGPTVFAVFDDKTKAGAAADKLGRLGYNPIIANPVKCGIEFE